MGVKMKWNATPKLWLEVEANSVTEAIEIISGYATVFSITKCGKCGSERVRPEHRVASGYNFYNIRCDECGAQFDFGQHKEGGTLFPKRDKGWYVYQGGSEGGPAAPTEDGNRAFSEAAADF